MHVQNILNRQDNIVANMSQRGYQIIHVKLLPPCTFCHVLMSRPQTRGDQTWDNGAASMAGTSPESVHKESGFDYGPSAQQAYQRRVRRNSADNNPALPLGWPKVHGQHLKTTPTTALTVDVYIDL